MKRLLTVGLLFLFLVAGVAGTAWAAICADNPDVMCGHRCSSNSCVQDALSVPEKGCWLDYSTIPVSCISDEDDCCKSSGPGL